MRFVADESCDFSIVRALRENGHDVIAISEITSRSHDREVLALTSDLGGILLTEDKDFGELVYNTRLGLDETAARASVILMRFPAQARSAIAHTVLEAVHLHGDKLRSAFTVIQPGRVRVSSVIPP